MPDVMEQEPPALPPTVALIIGVGSRRGMALARYLANHPSKNYQLHVFALWQDIERLRNRFAEQCLSITMHTPNVGQTNELVELLRDQIRPAEIYNLHQSENASSPFSDKHFIFGKNQQDHPEETMVDGMVTLRLLDAVRIAGLVEKVRFFQEQRISYSDAFCLSELPQRHFETPNACTKMFSHWTVRKVREAQEMFAITGSFFDRTLAADEQPVALFADDICQRLALEFADMRLRGRLEINLQLHDNEMIGTCNGDVELLLDRRYEFAHVDDFAEAMWLALNNNGDGGYKTARDCVIASRQFHSLREFCQEAFAQVLKSPPSISWHVVTKQHVVAKDAKSRAVLNVIFNGKPPSPTSQRPSSASSLSGEVETDEKIAKIVDDNCRWLSWQPKCTFSQIVGEYLKIAENSLAPTCNNGAIKVNAPIGSCSNLLLLEN